MSDFSVIDVAFLRPWKYLQYLILSILIISITVLYIVWKIIDVTVNDGSIYSIAISIPFFLGVSYFFPRIIWFLSHSYNSAVIRIDLDSNTIVVYNNKVMSIDIETIVDISTKEDYLVDIKTVSGLKCIGTYALDVSAENISDILRSHAGLPAT